MGRKNFNPGTLTAPLPPVMATVGDMENSNIITIGWTGILASDPPRTYISVRPQRYSHGLLKEGGEFVINLPTVALAKTVDYVGIFTGKKVDKFKECGLTKVKSEKVAPPTIGECPVALECRVYEVVSMGTHDVFMADIVGVSCDESIIDENGRMQFDKADLLAYAHGEYFALGEKVGTFGFSAAKKKAPDKSAAKKSGEQKAKPVETALTKTEEKSENKKRPFYLDAPRGKGQKKAKSKGGKRR